MRKSGTAIFLMVIAILLPFSSYSADPIKITVTIKPVHSLVAAVADGVATPYLLLDKNQSPHNYALKPSDMRQIQESDVIFLVGYELEAFLKNTLSDLDKNQQVVELIDIEGVALLPTRGHDADEEESHHHGKNDAHIWLSPDNAIVMTRIIAKTLSDKDPANAAIYNKNADELIAKITAQAEVIKGKIAPYSKDSFIVFHDAFQYFEKFANIHSIGAIMPPSGEAIGAKRLKAISELAAANNTKCLFVEPQYPKSAAKAISQNGKIRVVSLDDIGTHTQAGKDAYLAILNSITDNIVSCLAHE